MKNYKKITYILIIIALVVFSTSVAFKIKAQNNYYDLDNHLSELKLNTDYGQQLELLKKKCIPFTYFDEATDLQLEKILNFTGDNNLLLEEEVFRLQKMLHERQQKLLLSFDFLMYCSLILILIAISVIIYDLFAARNELNKVQTINDQQIKFSRDLHDGLAQDLAALKMYMERKDEEKTSFYAIQALSEVRYLIDSMRVDLSKPLEITFKETLENFEINYQIKTHLLVVGPNLNKIKSDIQIELFRILQEALSNIARHSGATDVTIKITEIGEDLKFTIKDNGKGFSEAELDEKLKSDIKKHYGVKNIKDRVTAMGGTVEFINDGGTTIAISIKDIIH